MQSQSHRLTNTQLSKIYTYSNTVSQILSNTHTYTFKHTHSWSREKVAGTLDSEMGAGEARFYQSDLTAGPQARTKLC